MELNFFDTYALMAIQEEVVPQASFFKDRYFATGDGDIFASDKVLTEYREGDRKMAAMTAQRAGSIALDREGYSVREYQPAYIGVSRILTVDDLKKRGFGEALYATSTPAERAAKLIQQDLTEMTARITRREEWLAVQTMLHNGCTMQEYIDAKTAGEETTIVFYNGSAHANDHIYTVTTKWDATNADIRGDVRNMCRMLSSRGLRAADLVVGSDVADAIYNDASLREAMNLNSNIAIGGIREELSKYDGVVFMGTLNFGGYVLNVIACDETYVDDAGTEQKFFPATSAMVTAPGCGHMMFGQITQIDFGSSEFTSHAGVIVPKFVVDQANDTRKLQLASRPLAAPKNYCPFIVANSVV